jgi:hypothetical protein
VAQPAGQGAPIGQGAAPDPNIIPFQPRARSTVAEGLWAQVLTRLHRDAPALTTAWFAQLSEAARDEGHVTLMAPSRFVAGYVSTHLLTQLLAAYSAVDPSVRRVEVVAGEV